MSISEIQSYIAAIEKDASLYQEKNFERRIEVLDFIEASSGQLIALKNRAEKIRDKLLEIDANLFQKLQADIRTGRYTGKEFKNLVDDYVRFYSDGNKHQGEPGYDNLDIFINGLSPLQTMPEQTKDLEPEMVYYQKTPARIVFELVEKAHFTKEDVFFDLGSGLGHTAILVNLLTGIKTIGVEFEPAFCVYARDCAAGLNLSNVTFKNMDARNADYSEGTIFFMYTPFGGEMLREVLAVLKKESLLRKIKIITYGPCTAQVASQGWLNSAAPEDDNIYKLAVFS
jgi:predicted RNA methylase